jgi:hypothetical protein
MCEVNADCTVSEINWSKSEKNESSDDFALGIAAASRPEDQGSYPARV